MGVPFLGGHWVGTEQTAVAAAADGGINNVGCPCTHGWELGEC